IADLVELAKDPLEFLRLDADAGVVDGEAKLAAPAPAPDDYAPHARIADGVDDEIAGDSLEQHRIAAHDSARRHETQAQAFSLRLGRAVEPDAVEYELQPKIAHLGLHDAGVELRDVE